MRITKFGHSCVRMEHDGISLVLDPGVFATPDAVADVDAVLITHEHPDHYAPDLLAATDARIFTIEAVATKIRQDAPALAERVTVVHPGESVDAGLPVRAVGELHAVIHPEFPGFFNSGYLVTLGDQMVYHPGDALTDPGEHVDVLCSAGLGALAEDLRGPRLRPVGRGAAQPRHPRPGLQRVRSWDRREPPGPVPRRLRAALRPGPRRLRSVMAQTVMARPSPGSGSTCPASR